MRRDYVAAGTVMFRDPSDPDMIVFAITDDDGHRRESVMKLATFFEFFADMAHLVEHIVAEASDHAAARDLLAARRAAPPPFKKRASIKLVD